MAGENIRPGNIGSRKKADALKVALRERGVAPERLAKLRAPAGLDLGVDGFRCDYANGPSHAFWSEFRAAIRERGRAGLGERTSSGWTYKDLVAHVVGWMQQTVREMQTNEFTSGWTSATIQEYNDRSVRTHQLVGAEAMVDELDTVYKQLLETLRGLPAGDLDEKIAGTLPYYTYLHWEEHFAELGIPL